MASTGTDRTIRDAEHSDPTAVEPPLLSVVIPRLNEAAQTIFSAFFFSILRDDHVRRRHVDARGLKWRG